MPGNYSRYQTVSAGDTITAANYNGEFDTIRTNFTPAGLDDASSTLVNFQATFDPGESGTENIPTSLADELQAVRHLIKEITGKTYWYESPTINLATICPVGTIIPFYDFNGNVTFDNTIWAYCDGSTVNSATSLIDGETLPDLSNRYLVGYGTEGGTDIDSAAWNATAVGSASHQIDLEHTHVDGGHTHTLASHTHAVGTLQFVTFSGNATSVSGYYSNGTAVALFTETAVTTGGAVTSVNVALTGATTMYTGSGTGSVAASSDTSGSTAASLANSLSATQSIQPRSIRVRYLIRYL
jgi:hypothetical protein